MKNGLPQFDYEVCIACGVCVQTCPFDCLELGKVGVDANNNAYPQLSDSEKCTSCQMCEKQCPIDAVVMVV